MSNADKAEAKDRVWFFLPVLGGSLIFPFGAVGVSSTAACAIVRGCEGG